MFLLGSEVRQLLRFGTILLIVHSNRTGSYSNAGDQIRVKNKIIYKYDYMVIQCPPTFTSFLMGLFILFSCFSVAFCSLLHI